ncbi:serine/threonine-protein kinase [Ruminococcus difficilis]|uniref:Serine/threonine protein kinase n=1 Tax=Ruminococcus difficilis TaxID=2763069 RepID=A0A934WQJ7_9FIRM|nr:serine/threonine-protein kinase [Ruminococcus difficilis]MBK6088103.1 serine/threonine protein kinase [Ruminococcus difficilis]
MVCKKCNKEIGNAAECPYCGAVVLIDPLPHHLPVGALIGGRFSVEGVLGEGGFGITYLTRDNKLGSLFAVKEYYPRGISYRDNTGTNEVYVSSKDDTDFYNHGKERFLSEARTLARFSEEPGVVSVTDFIEENDTVYLVMEYLRGETLQKYLKMHDKLSADEAFHMLEPVIKTLEKIHAAGVIHRDISPDNIMVLKNGQLKLMDFGAAKEYIDDNRSMSVMLKKGYAPMEQYRRNGKQGPWTDVYAMCATIYRCITGKTPDDALDRVVEDNLQKPSALGADITPQKEAVLMHGMAVHQQDRCRNMTELLRLWNGASDSAIGNTNQTADPNATIYADEAVFDSNATVYADETQVTGKTAKVQKPITTHQMPIPNQQAPKPKKKSKAGVIIGVVAAVLVVLIIAGVVIVKPLVSSISGTSNKNNASTVPTLSSGNSSSSWSVTDTAWNIKKDDNKTKLTSVSIYQTIYYHFKLKSTKKNATIKPIIKITKPDKTEETYVYSEALKDGWSWYSFSYDDPKSAKAGTLVVTVADESGNKIFTDSILLKD